MIRSVGWRTRSVVPGGDAVQGGMVATHKIVIHSAGGYDRMKLETHAVPRPAPGQVRIDVRAIGVNYADTIVRMGLYSSAKEYVGWPITPGFEVSGTVG